MSTVSGVPQQPTQYPQQAVQGNPIQQNANQNNSAPQTTYEKGQGGNGVVINIYNPIGTKNGGTEPAPPAAPQQQNQSIPFPAAQKLDKTKEQKPPEPPKKEEPKKPAKPTVPLTDSYIITLENYLNSKNADIRSQGTKEILKRFKEDDSRKTDIALTNLLNKALQDPSQKVRLIALGALQGNYATGDPLTYKLLQKMQNSKSTYNQDATTASNILLQRAGQNLNVKTNDKVQATQPQKSQQGQNLNVVAK